MSQTAASMARMTTSKTNERMKKVYLSGRISDLTREQYMQMFSIAEDMLKKKNYKVKNPSRFWISRHYRWLVKLFGEENAYRLTLLYDLWQLMKCDLIYKLPSWQQSRGANIESCVAYHFKVWPMSPEVVKKIDKRLEKLIKKFDGKPTE